MTKFRKNHTHSAESARELGRMIGEVSQAWRQEMNQRLKPFGLNLSMRQVLMQLQANPAGLAQSELAARLGIEGPTLVRLLDKLEERDWIRRAAVEGDRRRKHAVLTAKAFEQIRLIETLSGTLRSRIMSGLSQEQIDISLQVMQHMKSNMPQ